MRNSDAVAVLNARKTILSTTNTYMLNAYSCMAWRLNLLLLHIATDGNGTLYTESAWGSKTVTVGSLRKDISVVVHT